MSSNFSRYGILGTLVLMSLGGCIVEPLGEGHGGGREHEDRDGRDRGGEHRHDFGVSQRERLGFYQPYGTAAQAVPVQASVFTPAAQKPVLHGIWG